MRGESQGRDAGAMGTVERGEELFATAKALTARARMAVGLMGGME
jgi:hypothetical protein